MRINASWFGLHWPTEYKYVGASVCVHRQAPLGYGYQLNKRMGTVKVKKEEVLQCT